MTRLAVSIAGLAGWRRWAAAFLAGAVSPLAMAPFHLWPVLLASLPALVWIIDGCRMRAASGAWRRGLLQATGAGWCFGFGYFLTGLYWIGHAFLVEADQFAWLLPFAVSLLPAGLALFFAAASMAAFLLWRPGAARVLALALAVMASEWLRGHVLTGLPWIAIGYALTGGEVMMQAAALIGVYGLTPFVVLALASPATVWAAPGAAHGPWRARLALPVTMALLLAVSALWGAVRLSGAEAGFVEGVRLRIVQPNIPQSQKWKPENRNWVFQTYLEVSRYGSGARGPEPLAGITHLIWPESAVPFLLAETPSALAAVAELLPPGSHFMTGAARGEPDPANPQRWRIFNSVYVMDDESRILATYDKVHLVPFGEYLPFQATMEAIGLAQLTGVRGGFAAGAGPRLMRAPGAPAFVALICYEIVFPGAVVDAGTRPEWMLNVTNDGWFGMSTGPYQHLHQARVRAVEEGLPVVRAANTGISAIIDAHGRLGPRLALGRGGALDGALPRPISPPLYARWGGLIEGLLALALAAAWLVLARAPGLIPDRREPSRHRTGGRASGRDLRS